MTSEDSPGKTVLIRSHGHHDRARVRPHRTAVIRPPFLRQSRFLDRPSTSGAKIHPADELTARRCLQIDLMADRSMGRTDVLRQLDQIV